MKNNQWLFEFEDLPWFPHTIRQGMTDYLHYFLKATNFYRPVAPLLHEAMKACDTNQLIDLCSGSGGPAEEILENLKAEFNFDARITLTDKFPNPEAWRQKSGAITYIEFPVNATLVPGNLIGFRTIFSGFHHFNRSTATKILKDATSQNVGIGIFDGGDKNLLTILGIVLFHPIGFFFATPFFRAFRLSRLLFTYVIPVIPICTVWDGVVSIIRLYRPKDLLAMAQSTGADHYIWHTGKVTNGFGMRVAYLIGYPKKDEDAA